MRESEIALSNKYNQDIILLGGKQEVWGHWTVNYTGTQKFYNHILRKLRVLLKNFPFKTFNY